MSPEPYPKRLTRYFEVVLAMKIPLDYICVKSGVLCPRCRHMVESGQVQKYEIEVIRHLIELEERDPAFRFLRDATYVKSYMIDDFLVLIIDILNDVAPQTLIRLARVLGERLNMKVRAVKRLNDMKMVIAQILSPARIQGVNTVWSPDGTVQYVVRISRYDARFLPISIDELEKLLNMIFNKAFKIKLV